MTVDMSPIGMTRMAVLADRWPDVAGVPRTRVNAAIAAALVRRVASRLPVRIELPTGVVLPGRKARAATDPALPVLRLNNPKAFFRRLGHGGLVGFGEAYQAGDWDADDLAGVLSVFAGAADRIVPSGLQWLRHLHGARQPRDERNSLDGAKRNIHRHYDLSNDLFTLFLDRSMTYSSALFDREPAAATWADLPGAQHAKMDRLLDAVRVGDGTRLLEVGTGWGELAIRAAQRGARVHTVTISREQRDLARQRALAAGVADRVDVDLRDYREIDTTTRYDATTCYDATMPRNATAPYDAIVSVEMIEAVGERYWPAYFTALDRLLAPGGKVGIQAITMRHERMLATRRTYTWMHKYIFPGGLIPSVEAIRQTTAAHTSLRLTSSFAFGHHYAATLRLWRDRFNAQSGRITALGFDEIFRRTWNLYLAYSEAGFRTGYLDVHHLVLERAA
jgi:cyclopropane-fatty-acyl-phospholipid synthase